MNFSMQRNIELVRDYVNKCTNDFLFQADYEKNLEVVDKINNNPSLASFFMKTIEEALTGANTEMKACLTIELLKTILQNCLCFIPVYSKKKYQDAVANFVLTTKYLRARDEMLQVIQMLGVYYSGDSEYNFMQTYNRLLYLHHLNFPPHQEIFEPPRVTNLVSARMQEIDDMTFRTGKGKSSDKLSVDQPFDIATQRQYRQLCASIRNPKVEELVRSYDNTWKIATDALDHWATSEKQIEDNDTLHSIILLMKTWHESIIGWIQNSDMNLNEREVSLLFLINDQIVDIMKRYDAINMGAQGYKLKCSRQTLHSRKHLEKFKKKPDRRESTESIRGAFMKIASRKREVLENLGEDFASKPLDTDLMSLLSDSALPSSSKTDKFLPDFSGLSLSQRSWINPMSEQRVDSININPTSSKENINLSSLLSLQSFPPASSPIHSPHAQSNSQIQGASPIQDMFQNVSSCQLPVQEPSNVSALAATTRGSHSTESDFFSQKQNQFQTSSETRIDEFPFQRHA